MKENEEPSNNSKRNITPSSLKNNKFKGMTAEQIIKKYEDVLFSREKQFYELSNEIDIFNKCLNFQISPSFFKGINPFLYCFLSFIEQSKRIFKIK